MFDLETALKQRLAALKSRNSDSAPKPVLNNSTDNVSEEYILSSLQQAGILNKQGKMINRKIE